MRAIAEEERLMPHFHLSVQAGDDMILKRMKRRHSRDDTIEFCETVRRLRPEAAFGADLIAGFPTESEAMFANTLGLVDEAGLTYLHVFPFSPRPGTPAARMPQLSRKLVKDRARADCAPRARPPWPRISQQLQGSDAGTSGGAGRASAARRASRRCALRARPSRAVSCRVRITGADGKHLIGTSMRTFGEAPPPPTLMERLKSGLSRSTGALGANLAGVFTKTKLDAETVAELEEALIAADLGAGLAAKLAAAVAKGRYDKEISEGELRAVLAEEIAQA